MTTSEPDPRTDLAGYLGLDADDIEECRIDAIRYPKVLTGKVGARLIEQDQDRADEPDDGLIPVTDEQIEAFRAAWLKADNEGRSGQRVRAGLEAVFALITDPDPVEGPPGTVPAFIGWNVGEDDPHDHYPWTWTPLLPQDGGPVIGGISTPNGRRPDGSMHTFWSVASDVWEPIGHLICHVVNQWAHEQFGTPALPAPKPPWKSPLDDLPDLTEEDCNVAYAWADRYEDDDNLARLDRDVSLMVQIGRALIAAGWTPEGEA